MLSGVTLIILSKTYFIVWSLPELSPLRFGSKTRFDWSKSFEWLRRGCQHRFKRWPIKMGFRGVMKKWKMKKKLSYRIIRIKRIFSGVYWCVTWTKSLTNLHKSQRGPSHSQTYIKVRWLLCKFVSDLVQVIHQ